MSANVTASCRAIGFSRTAIYRRRKNDPAFAEAWDWAIQEAADALEEEMYRRGVVGIDKPVMYQGQQVGTVKDYSDSLLIQLLKARRPEKFNERLQARGSAGDLLVEHKITLKRRDRVPIGGSGSAK